MVVVIQRTKRCDQVVDGQTLVSCMMKYPMMVPGAVKINALYERDANLACAECAGALKNDAADDLKQRQQSDFPFNPYQSLMDYQLTLNMPCLISLYIDRYSYTGGAHGGTQRTGDTWDLVTNRRMPLERFFPGNPNHLSDLTEFVQAQMQNRVARGEMFFDDAVSLVPKMLRPENFYLTPEGITLFFQQYDLAPYAAGIQEFTLAWGELGSARPDC